MVYNSLVMLGSVLNNNYLPFSKKEIHNNLKSNLIFFKIIGFKERNYRVLIAFSQSMSPYLRASQFCVFF